MKTRHPARLLLLFFLMFPIHETARAQQQDISEFEQRIAKINEQIKDLKVKIAEEGQKESSVLSTLAKFGMTKELLGKELKANSLILEKTEGELKGIKENILKRQTLLDREREAVERTLITLYKFGRFDFMEFALKTNRLETLLSQSKNLSYLARYQDAALQRYVNALAELQSAEARLDGKKKEISELIRISGEKKKEIETEEQKSRELAEKIQMNRKSYGQVLGELHQSAGQLQELIRKIGSQEYSLTFNLIPLYEKKGKLLWPLDGKIITAFGLQKHPRFNTTTLNNGIEISPKKGRVAISAVHPGRVVFSDDFQGYGKLVILDHGMGYYSLYGHCSEFLVGKGDAVKAGQPIAMVGDTGSLKGECLYFELRFKTKALDPLQWLRRK